MNVSQNDNVHSKVQNIKLYILYDCREDGGEKIFKCMQIAVERRAQDFIIYRYLKGKRIYVKFQVFTAVTMGTGVYWDVTPCSSCMNRSCRRK
jgi:hypothetical protein